MFGTLDCLKEIAIKIKEKQWNILVTKSMKTLVPFPSLPAMDSSTHLEETNSWDDFECLQFHTQYTHKHAHQEHPETCQ